MKIILSPRIEVALNKLLFDFADAIENKKPAPIVPDSDAQLILAAVKEGADFFIQKEAGATWVTKIIHRFYYSSSPFQKCTADMYTMLTLYQIQHDVDAVIMAENFLFFLEGGLLNKGSFERVGKFLSYLKRVISANIAEQHASLN